MTSEEIVKALRRCATINVNRCYECPARYSALKSNFDCDVHMKTEAADLIERLEKEKAERWIPVTERLPEDGQDVLCWYEYFRYGEYNAMFETYGIGYQYCGNWGGEVSHGTNARVLAWMPLPKAPEVE